LGFKLLPFSEGCKVTVEWVAGSASVSLHYKAPTEPTRGRRQGALIVSVGIHR